MKQLVILSGKGGTGKTSVAAAFAHLANTEKLPIRAVLADADVDAANLELVLRSERIETNDFIGGSIANIDQERCNRCGICEQICRFDSIQSISGGYSIDPIACDGCAACVYQCPEEAIQMVPQAAGEWYYSESRYGPFFHADLLPGHENSGKLVTLVKQNARLRSVDTDTQLLIVDGPPGIGCPVIAAAAGADLALIVTEPSVAGAHDLKRILKTTLHFGIASMVVINKADIYPEGSAQIEAYCREQGIQLIGRIPFDSTITDAMIDGEPVTSYKNEASASQAIISIWQTIIDRLLAIGAPDD